jgi:hypothetical protein
MRFVCGGWDVDWDLDVLWGDYGGGGADNGARDALIPLSDAR